MNSRSLSFSFLALFCVCFPFGTSAAAQTDSFGRGESADESSSGAVSASAPKRVTLGIISFLASYDSVPYDGFVATKTSPQDRINYLDAIVALGAPRTREAVMNWRKIQPQRNAPFDFESTDDLVRKASERGVEIMGLFFFPPDWACGDDQRSLLPNRDVEPDFRRFVRATVARYCGVHSDCLKLKKPVRHWIFYNEPAYHPEREVDEYAYWLKIFYEEIKSVDQGASVIAPAVTAHGRFRKRFLIRLLESENLGGPKYPYFDICDFHVYAQDPDHYPEEDLRSFDLAYAHVQGVLDKAGLESIPIWLTETGCRAGEREQAVQMIKNLIHACCVGVDRVYAFGLWDLGPRQRWGAMHDMPSGEKPVPKLYYIAYQTMLRKISDTPTVDRLGPGQYRAVTPAGKEVFILWEEGDGASPIPITGKARVTDLEGHVQEVAAGAVALTSTPIFLESLGED